MSLVTETLFGTEDKVALSIEALRTFEPEDGYYLAFSGGKDSVVIKALCDMAGVKYDAHYSVTSVDPPELVQFIKEQHPDVVRDIPHDGAGQPLTMWNIIPPHLMPPTQLVRYCCEVLKETGGYGRLVVTGVRWAESRNRKQNQGLITIYKKGARDIPSNFPRTPRGGVVLNNDNEETREFVESCYRKKKTVLNPIINWEDEDVWEFIRTYQIPYCKLYDEGRTRIGCIGCPMGNNQEAEFERWPKYRQMYLRAFNRMLEERKRRGLKTTGADWTTAEDVMDWWTRRKTDKTIDGQIAIELEEDLYDTL